MQRTMASVSDVAGWNVGMMHSLSLQAGALLNSQPPTRDHGRRPLFAARSNTPARSGFCCMAATRVAPCISKSDTRKLQIMPPPEQSATRERSRYKPLYLGLKG